MVAQENRRSSAQDPMPSALSNAAAIAVILRFPSLLSRLG